MKRFGLFCLLGVAVVLSFSACKECAAETAAKPDECGKEEVCAAWQETAEGKIFARCGTNYECDCTKTSRECEPGLLGGKKYWFACDCKRKPKCMPEVCAVYESTATGKADLECGRTGCECKKTDRKCDTSFTGKTKYTFTCVCE